MSSRRPRLAIGVVGLASVVSRYPGRVESWTAAEGSVVSSIAWSDLRDRYNTNSAIVRVNGIKIAGGIEARRESVSKLAHSYLHLRQYANSTAQSRVVLAGILVTRL